MGVEMGMRLGMGVAIDGCGARGGALMLSAASEEGIAFAAGTGLSIGGMAVGVVVGMAVGTIIGAIVGALVGALVGVMVGVMAGMAAGMAAGVLVGAVIGGAVAALPAVWLG